MIDKDQANENIPELARRAGRDLLVGSPTLKDAMPIERFFAIKRAMASEQSTAAALMAAVHRDPSFGSLRNGWIQHIGGGQIIQNHMLPNILINAAIEGGAVDRLVEQARKLASSGTSSITSYTPIAGAAVSQSLVLAADIDLVPWENVSDSPQKEKFGGAQTRLESLSMGFPRLAVVPTAAIRTNFGERQILYSSFAEVEPTSRASLAELTEQNERIGDIVKCIVALAARPVAALGSWIQIDDGFASRVTGTSYYGSEALFDIHMQTSSPAALDGVGVAELFQRFMQMNSPEKRALRIALDRLNLALRKRGIVDDAIDLGIALEAMLLHGMGRDDRGELKFRQAVRGAIFLGGEKAERLKTFNLLRDAYDLRSRAVHTGTLDPEKAVRGMTPIQILDGAAGACASIARKLIERGSFPDWDSEYVLGA